MGRGKIMKTQKETKFQLAANATVARITNMRSKAMAFRVSIYINLVHDMLWNIQSLSGVLEASKCGFLRQLCSHTWQGPWHRPGPMDPDGSRWIQGNQTAAPKKVRRTSAGARRKSSSPSACANEIHRNDPQCLKSLNISRNGTDSAFILFCLASDYDYTVTVHWLSETWGKTSQWCRSCWQPKNSSQGLSEAGYRDWIGGTSSVEQCQAVDESLAVNENDENDENEFITFYNNDPINLIDRLVLPRTRNRCVGFKSITPKSLLRWNHESTMNFDRSTRVHMPGRVFACLRPCVPMCGGKPISLPVQLW